tara:strand:+ start:1422 stop:1703 length:282 start_codon:yes stop_codon:yes gene_type:complete
MKAAQRHRGSKTNQLLEKYSIAQVEFEKIVGFEKAIEMTIQIKIKVVGYELLSNCSELQLNNLLKKLRSLYAHVVKNSNNFPERSIDDTSNSN